LDAEAKEGLPDGVFGFVHIYAFICVSLKFLPLKRRTKTHKDTDKFSSRANGPVKQRELNQRP
jgi:hypothetical protein